MRSGYSHKVGGAVFVGTANIWLLSARIISNTLQPLSVNENHKVSLIKHLNNSVVNKQKSGGSCASHFEK